MAVHRVFFAAVVRRRTGVSWAPPRVAASSVVLVLVLALVLVVLRLLLALLLVRYLLLLLLLLLLRRVPRLVVLLRVTHGHVAHEACLVAAVPVLSVGGAAAGIARHWLAIPWGATSSAIGVCVCVVVGGDPDTDANTAAVMVVIPELLPNVRRSIVGRFEVHLLLVLLLLVMVPAWPHKQTTTTTTTITTTAAATHAYTHKHRHRHTHGNTARNVCHRCYKNVYPSTANIGNVRTPIASNTQCASKQGASKQACTHARPLAHPSTHPLTHACC